jgi:ligand-binding SRPBCC domain-containing protein
MKPYTLERTIVLPTDLDTAWNFFSDPGNLPKITPPAMDFRITSGPQNTTYAGQIITYTLRPLMGVTMAWTTEITHVSRPDLFVDEQRFGPYRFWHHQHFFRQVEDGVEIRDLVHYLLPHMQLTGLVNRLFVMPRLKQIFDYRSESLLKIFTENNSAKRGAV